MTSKLPRERLIEETAEELITYLRGGRFNSRALAHSLDYQGLSIDDWERIKRIHFCLSKDVIDFVEILRDGLRGIKTETQGRRSEIKPEVRGKIDWSTTLQGWSETGYLDTSGYSCELPYAEYDIAENRILKQLLWIIYEGVQNDLREIDYDWRRSRWSDNQIEEYSRLYRGNVHLNRMPKGSRIRVSERDMKSARQSRLPIYTKAYDLLDRYRRLEANDFGEDVHELIAPTIVAPLSDARLFEVFCVFRIIRLMNELIAQHRIHPIETGSGALASFESGSIRIDVFHDNTGNLQFHEPIDPNETPSPELYRRFQESKIGFQSTYSKLTGENTQLSLYSGRPDLVIEAYDIQQSEDTPAVAVIGEIKNTTLTETVKTGIEELVGYLYFAQSSKYLRDDPQVSLHGLIISNGIDSYGAVDNISHLDGRQLRIELAEKSTEMESFLHILRQLSITSAINGSTQIGAF